MKYGFSVLGTLPRTQITSALGTPPAQSSVFSTIVQTSQRYSVRFVRFGDAQNTRDDGTGIQNMGVLMGIPQTLGHQSSYP